MSNPRHGAEAVIHTLAERWLGQDAYPVPGGTGERPELV